jgi:hypothetical protein
LQHRKKIIEAKMVFSFIIFLTPSSISLFIFSGEVVVREEGSFLFIFWFWLFGVWCHMVFGGDAEWW